MTPKYDPAPAGKKQKSGYNPLVPALDQASRLLIYLTKAPRFKMTLTEICQGAGMHKGRAYSILHTLSEFGFVEKDPQTKTYSLGLGLLSLSRRVLDDTDFRDIGKLHLEMLAKETQSTALLGLITAEQFIVVARHEGDRNIGITVRIGHRFHFTSGAHGKAIVAFLPENEREAILARKKLFFYGEGEMSGAKMERLKRELAECRKLGYAYDTGGLQPGINAISSPVFNSYGRIPGCVILIGTFPASSIQEYGNKVAQAAQKISQTLGAEIERTAHGELTPSVSVREEE